MEVLFAPIITALIVTIILSLIFKGAPKVDEGFAFNYYKLSYRRKFIRSLITLPLSIVFIIVVYLITDWSMFVNLMLGVILLVLFVGQIIYNYYMWKRNEA
ncbi:MAG TPA: hypothetical protein VK067_05670 [Pseudogracilibacillus sp.]|nr:hypothetical protein [Pseudogracilibacillus sp.]